MKKIIFLLLMIFTGILCYGENYTISNNYMSLSFDIIGKNVLVSGITDSKTHTEFIKDTDRNKHLWYFSVKENPASEEISVFPENAEKISVSAKKTSLQITWENVKNSYMENSYNVICTVKLNKNNSYWDIELKPNRTGKNPKNIWTVTYPVFNDINAQDSDILMSPYKGGTLFRTFSNPWGFKLPYMHTETEESYSKDMGYILPCFMQLSSFTKGSSSLYLCGEDVRSNVKSINYNLLKPNHLDYIVRNFPADMGKINEYKQAYSFNLAIVEGDYYDCAKKYRKWGIENNYAPFSKGLLENRTDLSEEYKKNQAVLLWSENVENAKNSVIDSKKILNVPLFAHLYHWSEYKFDTHYPNFLPAKKGLKEKIKEVTETVPVMPYTNALIADINQAPSCLAAAEKGKEMLTIKENGQVVDTMYNDNGASNKVACICSPYYETYLGEALNIIKELNTDMFYMDQIGATQPYKCFNEKHSHPVGGGTYFAENYNKLINECKEKMSEIHGSPVAVTTEDSGDAYCYDGWLRCNDNIDVNIDTAINMYVYSGYVPSFGSAYWPEDFMDKNSIGAMCKVATDFTKGIQPGWWMGSGNEFSKFKDFSIYFQNMIKGRYKAVNYFNFGEKVREAKIISQIPKINVLWTQFSGNTEVDFNTVRTGSFYYKGKTCVAFTNVLKTSCQVVWETKGTDLNLKAKAKYNVSQFYPENKKELNTEYKYNYIKSAFTIEPFETVCFVIN